jgi:hypothetical protein
MRCEATAEERADARKYEKCVRCGAMPGERCRSVRWTVTGLTEGRASSPHVLRIYALRRARKEQTG